MSRATCRKKEARLILRLGIYIFCYQYFGTHGLLFQGLAYNDKVIVYIVTHDLGLIQVIGRNALL